MKLGVLGIVGIRGRSYGNESINLEVRLEGMKRYGSMKTEKNRTWTIHGMNL